MDRLKKKKGKHWPKSGNQEKRSTDREGKNWPGQKGAPCGEVVRWLGEKTISEAANLGTGEWGKAKDEQKRIKNFAPTPQKKHPVKDGDGKGEETGVNRPL